MTHLPKAHIHTQSAPKCMPEIQLSAKIPNIFPCPFFLPTRKRVCESDLMKLCGWVGLT